MKSRLKLDLTKLTRSPTIKHEDEVINELADLKSLLSIPKFSVQPEPTEKVSKGTQTTQEEIPVTINLIDKCLSENFEKAKFNTTALEELKPSL